MTKRALLLGLLLLALGCGDQSRYDQAVAVLIDVSGTYADQKADVVRIIKREVLPSLEPGDTLIVVRIDSESYQKENLEALVTLDHRPSRANAHSAKPSSVARMIPGTTNSSMPICRTIIRTAC